MMTFEQFQATRKHVEDLADVVGFGFDEPQPGYVYADDLHIFDMPKDSDAGQFLLAIGNSQRISDDLESLERDLYEFGVSEGLLVS